MSRPKNSSKYTKYDEQIRSSLLQGKTYKTIVDELNNLAGTYDEFTDVGLRYSTFRTEEEKSQGLTDIIITEDAIQKIYQRRIC